MNGEKRNGRTGVYIIATLISLMTLTVIPDKAHAAAATAKITMMIALGISAFLVIFFVDRSRTSSVTAKRVICVLAAIVQVAAIVLFQVEMARYYGKGDLSGIIIANYMSGIIAIVAAIVLAVRAEKGSPEEKQKNEFTYSCGEGEADASMVVYTFDAVSKKLYDHLPSAALAQSDVRTAYDEYLKLPLDKMHDELRKTESALAVCRMELAAAKFFAASTSAPVSDRGAASSALPRLNVAVECLEAKRARLMLLKKSASPEEDRVDPFDFEPTDADTPGSAAPDTTFSSSAPDFSSDRIEDDKPDFGDDGFGDKGFEDNGFDSDKGFGGKGFGSGGKDDDFGERGNYRGDDDFGKRGF